VTGYRHPPSSRAGINETKLENFEERNFFTSKLFSRSIASAYLREYFETHSQVLVNFTRTAKANLARQLTVG
jgi:hypothetical protein